MKKGIFSLLMAMLAIVGFANAQVVEIGNGVSQSSTTPTSSSYCYSYTQELWTAEEIGRSGTISSIAFNTTNEPCRYDRNIVVYMKNVSCTAFADSTGFEPIAASDQVFSGILPKDGNGWVSLELTTPFVYDSTSSLLIAIDDNSSSYSSKYYYYTSAPGKLIYVRSDSTNPDPFNLGAYNGNPIIGNVRANIQITFSDDTPAEQELAVEPEINMSFRPNNAWMAPFETALINITTGAVNVNNIDFANVAVFSLTETPEYPISLEADEEYALGLVTVRDEETEGDVTSTMTVTTNTRQASLFDVTASLYTAVEPDVWEFAREVTAFPYTDELADTIALYDNYDLPGSNEDGLDAVYKLVLEHDCVLNASVRGDNPKVAIYDENFGGQPGPMVDNTYPYEPNAGDFSEGFETGVFDANWAQGSPYGFVIDNSEAHSGTFSAKSNNYQISSSEAKMTLTYNVPADGQISFFWKFSGEGYSYDHPKFYIDGTLMTPASGWTPGGFDWTQATFAVTAGEHTFTWGYKKDNSVSGGQDRLWVDDITIGATRANTVTRENNELVDKFLPAGTYYLVASATSQPFVVSINAANAPCPEQATNFVPADDDDDVDPTRLTLSWELDEYATEYRLVFGSTYYCTETLVDWTSDLAESYTFAEALYNNTNYFWRVDQRNTECETLGEAIGFTTNFNRPTNLRSTSANGTDLYEGDVLNLKWDAIADRTFRQYNIYQDGELIGSTTNTYNPDTYTTFNVDSLTYNPEGYTFNVTALYDEGESGFSNDLVVFVAGEGEVDGHVYEQDGTTGIANATVTMTGEDVYGREQTYTFTTNAEGYYTGSILEGEYEGVATCDGYQDKPYENNPIEIFFDSLTADIDYIMDEVFAPVAQVIAEYYPDPEDPQSPYVKVYWDWNLMTGIVEDFETGDFSLIEWDNTVTANYPWQITTNNPYEGTYCMKSGNAGVHSSTSSIQVTVEIPNDGNMSFYVKASCENNYDKGYFYIDGEQKGSYTGSTNWANKTYAVTAGQHTFKWSYTKDSSMSSGDDCIYVDYIDFYQKPEPVQPGWQYYDDGVNVDAVGLGQGGSFLWGICFPSTMMGNFTGCTLSKVSMFDYAAHTGKIMIYQGGTSAPGTLVHQQPYTCTGANDFVETTLTTAIPVDPTQSLWIVLNNDNGQYIAATCEDAGDPNGRWISTNGTDWVDVNTYNLTATWMIRGYIGNAKGGRMYEAGETLNAIQPEFVVSNASASDLSLDPADTKPVVTKSASADANRAFQYFRVYRTDCYNFDYNLENTTVLCCELTDTAYIDVSWPDAAPGVYKWGVGCVYGGNRESEITWAEPVKVPATITREGDTLQEERESPIVWSNCLDKDMFLGDAEVSVTVLLNSADSPEGVNVTLTNLDEAEQEMYPVAPVTLDETGHYAWNSFRKGEYAVAVSRDGYIGENDTVSIWEATDLRYVLIEIINSVNDLYVSHTGWAMWEDLGGNSGPVPPVPGNDVIVKLTAGDIWGDGSGYQMLLDPTAALFGNIIPETGALSPNCTGNESIYDAFEYKIPENADGNCSTQNIVINNTVSITIPAGTYDWCIANPTPGDRIWIASAQGNVGGRQNDYVFEAGKTYEFVVSMMGQNDAVNVTITENGKRFVPAANVVPQGEGDVRVSNGIAKANAANNGGRHLESYKVLCTSIDGEPIFSGNTENPFIQLPTESLVEGDNYLVKVAAIYSTGMSEWTEAIWQYKSCENYEGINEVTLESGATGNVLTWVGLGGGTPPVPPVPGDDVIVKLTAGDNWGDGSGYQMLLDPTAALFGNIIPETGALSTNCTGNESIYNAFEYKIPENADGNCSTQNIVINNTVSITIPAGTYDWCIANPTPGDRIWIAAGQGNVGGRQNDYVFEAGKTYEFVVSMMGSNDAVNVTITENGKRFVPAANVVPQGEGDVRVATRENEFTYGFDNDLEGWTNIDNDGDGHVWYHSTNDSNHGVLAIPSHGGAGHLMSESYCNATMDALNPDNYLVSPQKYAISNGSTIKFWACAQDEEYPADHFGIAVSTTGNTSASDFTTIQEWTLTAKGGRNANPASTREGKGTREGNWYEFTCDLSAYAGQQAWIAIRHFGCTDQFIINIDDVTISANGGGGGGGGGTTADIVGYMIFRDGEYLGLTTETTFTDAEGGQHEYCVRVVYNGPAELPENNEYYSMSCPVCVDGGTSSCPAPEDLYAEYTWNNDGTYGTTLTWPYDPSATPVSEWLYYDNGTYSTSIGAGGTIYWGSMFPSAALSQYAGTSLTKVAVCSSYPCTATLNIYYGGATPAAGTLVHTQQVNFTGTGDFMEIALSTALPLDVNENLWITFYQSGETYPADACVDTGDANNRWVSEDGVAWLDLAPAGLPGYGWMIRGFVTNEAKGGMITELPAFKGNAGNGELSHTEVTSKKLDMSFMSDEVDHYNIYRSTSQGNYTLIGEAPANAHTYFDNLTGNAGVYYYQVTAVYGQGANECESEPASAYQSTNDYVMVEVTSIAENDATALYPNPTSGNITINAKNMNHVTVMSVLGQVVYDAAVNGDECVINMAQFNAGVYMVRIATENGVSTKRVTVVK